MLQSPGHSPRHVSSPSPSPYSGNSLQASGSSSSITPSNPSKKRPRVLDEDSYVAVIERIVERDFFPNISKLRDRLDWLEAIKTGDPIQIRDAQLKIIERHGNKGENGEEDVKLIGDVKRDRITDGYGTSDQPPSTLEGWNYTANNLLMYHLADRGEAPLTEEERATRFKGLTKEVNRGNTRFHGIVMDSRPKDDGFMEVLYALVSSLTPMPMSGRDQDKGKRYDLEDLRKTPNQFYVESGK